MVVLGVLHYFKEKVTIIASLFDSSDFPYSFEVYDFSFLRQTDYKKNAYKCGSESHSVKWVCWYFCWVPAEKVKSGMSGGAS